MSLKSYLLYVCMLFAVTLGQMSFGFVAMAQDKDENKMMEFYRLPNPDVFPALIMNLEEKGVFEKKSSRAPVLFFISEAFRVHPDKAEKWCIALAKAGENVRFDIGAALGIAGAPAANVCITEHLRLSEEDQKTINKVKPYDPTKEKISSAVLLDMLWGMFVASGDTRYVHRVIDALEEEVDGGINMASKAAEWSLGSMAMQHQLVKDTLLERSKTDEGARKQAIDAILSELEKKQ